MDQNEGWTTCIGLLIFIVICLVASWLGEKMHDPEKYYDQKPDWYQDQPSGVTCPGCDQ